MVSFSRVFHSTRVAITFLQRTFIGLVLVEHVANVTKFPHDVLRLGPQVIVTGHENKIII